MKISVLEGQLTRPSQGWGREVEELGECLRRQAWPYCKKCKASKPKLARGACSSSLAGNGALTPALSLRSYVAPVSHLASLITADATWED